MRILFLIILSLMISNHSWAYLTAGKVAVTATSSSSGVPSTSQDSDITDTKGSSVAVGVPVAVTGNVNITGNYQVNGTPISATSNWNQSGSTINYTAGNVGIGSTNPGQVLDVVGTVRASSFVGPSASPYIKFSEQETSGTSGGAGTTGSWQNRILNTKDFDTSSIASLCTGNGSPVATCTAANQMVLPAGTYLVNISSPYAETNATLTRLQNITSGTTLIPGTSEYSLSTVSNQSRSFIVGTITLAVTSALAIQYNIEATGTLGQASSFGTEVYTIAVFNKTS